ncbi:Hypothetical predicted protein [Cloeon dipterum]|uniref:Uncharacterized protein n=1 Tax=Cloeon dipterum TaxID=197152 RepID=A0A8S1DQU6_9INSE|nr:Hypothetical predicted protein [Cloeon dipterum]
MDSNFNTVCVSTIRKWIMILKRRLRVRSADPIEEAIWTELMLRGGHRGPVTSSAAASCATLVSWLEHDDNVLNERIEMKMATVI